MYSCKPHPFPHTSALLWEKSQDKTCKLSMQKRVWLASTTRLSWNMLRIAYGVVPHVAGGGPKVDDGGSLGTAGSKRVHVSHDVVPASPLLPRRQLKVDARQVCLHLLKLLVRNVQP